MSSGFGSGFGSGSGFADDTISVFSTGAGSVKSNFFSRRALRFSTVSESPDINGGAEGIVAADLSVGGVYSWAGGCVSNFFKSNALTENGFFFGLVARFMVGFAVVLAVVRFFADVAFLAIGAFLAVGAFLAAVAFFTVVAFFVVAVFFAGVVFFLAVVFGAAFFLDVTLFFLEVAPSRLFFSMRTSYRTLT
ncbi:MAG: hypothetical protein JRH15_03165 [Deltaproteobacteria bacterium]|nr:hypothetical protein [Deltaproteobacteria bacterium]